VTRRQFKYAEDGVAAVEFALFAPMLFVSILAMTDIGRAVAERAYLGQAVRAGAQAAMADPGASGVESVIEASAAEIFPAADPIAYTVARYCACPGAAETAVSCLATCTGSKPANIYYKLDADRTYDAILLPDIALAASQRVRVR